MRSSLVLRPSFAGRRISLQSQTEELVPSRKKSLSSRAQRSGELHPTPLLVSSSSANFSFEGLTIMWTCGNTMNGDNFFSVSGAVKYVCRWNDLMDSHRKMAPILPQISS
jgi:hypothetical protein